VSTEQQMSNAGSFRRPSTSTAALTWIRTQLTLRPQLLTVPLLFVVFIALWAWLVKALHVSESIVPTPWQVWAALKAGFSQPLSSPAGFWTPAKYTLEASLAGFALGSLLGLGLALVISWSRLLERTIMPYVIAFQAIPKIAVAPLFVVWFGFALNMKIYLATTVTFFPVLVNSLAGFRSAGEDSLLLMRSLRASRLQTFRLLVFPNALPYVFSGLEIAMVFSIISVIVGEFMGGSEGLGGYIQQQQALVNVPAVFAALIVLAVMGMITYGLIRLVARYVLRWSATPEAGIGL
jgi:NitT/TauT family transport system permease protein